jgi:hypothetical protein
MECSVSYLPHESTVTQIKFKIRQSSEFGDKLNSNSKIRSFLLDGLYNFVFTTRIYRYDTDFVTFCLSSHGFCHFLSIGYVIFRFGYVLPI